MSGKIISIANSKGGVGKTTTCVSLAEAFAAEGRRTLVVDLDMQANASMIVFGRGGDERLYEAIASHKTVTDYLDENFFGERMMRLSEFVTPRASDVTHTGRTLDISLVACSPGLRRTERSLIYELTSQGFSMHAIEGRVGNRLTADLEHLRKEFDIILCDCPPGISAMTETVLAASDLLIVPTIPDFMSTLGLDLFIGDVLPQLNRDSGDGLPYVLATRFTNSAHQRIVLNAMAEGAEGGDTDYAMLSTIIPATPDFAVNPIELGHAPTLAQKWPGEALGTLDALHKELVELLK
ncbi:MAG: AAA family ATPase [Hyphomonadaceae bacterium]|nr:AAA family ATPase [Hyphomonadaceae bacterium]